MTDLFRQSYAIANTAIAIYEPYAIVLAVSGGDDSLTAYHLSKVLGIRIDAILHINTRTGIQQTTEFVRKLAENEGIKYIEGDAGDTYEKYVLRKGFYGVGMHAHSYAYHYLKDQFIRKELAKIRQRKHNRNILILNGVRITESSNRAKNLKEPYRKHGSNIWVNLIHWWKKSDCMDFLADNKICRNPVSVELCRSGECMCGTMQSKQARIEASILFPKWGQWLDELEKKVMLKFLWGGGENMPKNFGALRNEDNQSNFQPMCSSCLKDEKQ